MPGTPRFVVHAHVTADLRHAPYLLDGLAGLADRGLVRLHLEARPPLWRDRVVAEDGGVRRVGRPYPWSIDLDVHDHEQGIRQRVAVDLQDWREMFSHRSLRTSQVVFKRMLVGPEAAAVEHAYGVQVLPAGITHAGDADRWAREGAVRRARVFGKVESAVNAPGRLADLRRRGHAEPGKSGARALPDLPEDYVFFQVAFHRWAGHDEAERLNRERAGVIRALRAALGERFVGGMTFSGPVPAGFEGCESTLPTDQPTYLDLVRRAAVVVATNGFGGSPPWKLAEYLQLGACVVAERPVAQLPEPLRDGEHALLFSTADEAVAGCARLLDDPGPRAGLGASARAYYEAQVAPDAAAWRFLMAGQAVPCPP